MKRRGAAICILALIALPVAKACASGLEPNPGSGPILEPYQMVRSLQLVQDRIAGGDHAALPMQNKLLELIDARFRQAQGKEFAKRANFDALMIYAMSGGNPATIAASLEGLTLDEADEAAARAILDYLAGNVAGAREAMARLSRDDYPRGVAAFLALVKGSVVANEDANAGMATLDQARLLAPGTLVEEAALRRTLSLAVTAADARRFTISSEQYARRFLRSPYAAQFAETFVSGIIALRDDLDLERLRNTVAWMTQEQAQTVYLRLARHAAIDGDARLLDFATQPAINPDADMPTAADPRRKLYSSISSVTSETVEDVLSQLSKLDTARLSTADKALLEAARTVAEEVVAPVSAARLSPLPAQDTAGDTQADPRIAAARSRLAEIDRMLEESMP